MFNLPITTLPVFSGCHLHNRTRLPIWREPKEFTTTEEVSHKHLFTLLLILSIMGYGPCVTYKLLTFLVIKNLTYLG